MSTLRVDTLVNRVGNGAPNFAYGLTAPSAVFTGNVSIGGTLTYEDVQNVDAVGLITARQGIKVTTGGIEVSSGVVTATSFSGDASQLTSIPSSNLTGALPAIDGSQLTGITQPGGDEALQFNNDVGITYGVASSNDKITSSWTTQQGKLEFKNYGSQTVFSITSASVGINYATVSNSYTRLDAGTNGVGIVGSCSLNGSINTNGLTQYPEFKIQGQPLRGYIPASYGGDGNTTTVKSADHTIHAYNDRGCLIRCSSGLSKVIIPSSVNGAAGGGTTINAGSVYTILNLTGGDITLEQMSALSMYIAGDSTTGDKTLADRGLATIYYYGYNEVIVTGNVS